MTKGVAVAASPERLDRQRRRRCRPAPASAPADPQTAVNIILAAGQGSP